MYRAVEESTAAVSTVKDLFLEKVNSSVDWEIFSNPINAQGEINAICITWDIGLLSETKPGSKENRLVSRLAMATAKQMTMPATKTIASSTALAGFRFSFRVANRFDTTLSFASA